MRCTTADARTGESFSDPAMLTTLSFDDREDARTGLEELMKLNVMPRSTLFLDAWKRRGDKRRGYKRRGYTRREEGISEEVIREVVIREEVVREEGIGEEG